MINFIMFNRKYIKRSKEIQTDKYENLLRIVRDTQNFNKKLYEGIASHSF